MNTTNSQAASISIDEEFIGLLMNVLDDAIVDYWENGDPSGVPELLGYIDAKLAQAFNDGAIEGRIHQRGIDDARIQATESRLAEIQRGVEGLTRYEFRTGFKLNVPAAGMLPDVLGNYVMFEAVEALFQPQGQADTSGLPG